jgi:hypothetical protein
MLDAPSHPKPTNLDIWLDKKLSFSLSRTNANRSAEPVDLGSHMHTNLTYDNTTAATRFIEFISTTEKEKLNDILSKMKFFSLTMDGSTDDSVTEQETIFLRTCMEGKIVNRFVCI